SISASSPWLKSSLSSAPRFSSNCLTELTPVTAEVMRGSRSTHARDVAQRRTLLDVLLHGLFVERVVLRGARALGRRLGSGASAGPARAARTRCSPHCGLLRPCGDGPCRLWSRTDSA